MAKADLSEVIYVSPSYEKVWGRSCAGLYDNPASWMDHIHPADIERVRAAVGRRSGAGHSLEYRIVLPDGTIRWIEDRGFPVKRRDGEDDRIAGIADDITDRKQAEETLQEYKRVIEDSQNMIALIDRDYRYRFANETYLKRRNIGKEELIGRSCREVVGSEAFEKTVKSRLDRCFLGEKVQYEISLPFPGLGMRDLLVSYSPIKDPEGITKVAAVVRDVTQYREYEEALKQSERRYRSLIENTPDGFVSFDMTNKIVEANSAFCAMLGYSEEEVRSFTHEELTPKQWHAQEEVVIREQLFSRGYSETYEKEYARKDGTTLPAEVRSHLLRNENGEPMEMQAFVRDISRHKRILSALEESEEKFRLIFENSSDPILLLDGETFIDCNEAAVRVMGCADRDGLIGRRPADLAPPYQADGRPSRDKAEEIIRAAFRDGMIRFEWTLRSFRGEDLVMDISLTVMPVQNRRILFTVWRDITERKAAEEALKRSEEKYRGLFESMTEAFALHEIICDERGEPVDYRFLEVNPGFERLTGLGRGQVIGRTVKEVLPGTKSHWLKTYGEVALFGRPARFVNYSSDLKKYYEVFAYRPAPRQFAVIFVDVTERKEMEEERAKLWSAVERAGEGVFMLTTDNRYSYVNAAFCKAYGFTQEELLGKSTDMTRGHRYSQSFHDSLWSRLLSGDTWSGRQTRTKKDGGPVDVETTIAPVRDASGAIVHYVGVERDITEQLQMEAQLLHAQKMEAIGTLAGGVAHDFNNILTVIMGLGNLIQMSLGPDDRIRPHVDQIVLSSEKAAELTQSLLAYSRKQRINLEPHSVDGVVRSTAKLLKRLLPEDIELKLDLASEGSVSLLDVSQIDQVLMNLATNARDAMPHGGSFVIRTGKTRLDNTFRGKHGFGKSGEYVQVSVSDTGGGMSEETMTRIFDPFFTTKEVGKGTGLGLASAYGIVKQHNGYIIVASRLGKGSTFDIYLPLVQATLGDKPAGSLQLKGGSETILVLEDDPAVRQMIAQILSSQGYAIIEAAGGDDAIKVYKEHKEKIGLVILDVVMPGKNGKEVLDEMAGIDPKVRAIFMSGYTGDVVIEKGIEKDSVDFLQKPLSIAKLVGKVREVLDRP